MKKAIVMILLLAVLVGGAIGAMAAMGVGPFGKLPPKKEEAVAPQPAPPAEPVLIEMETVAVPLIRGNDVPRQIFLRVQLSVEPAKKAEVTQQLPRLQDAVLRSLHDYLPMTVRDSALPDATLIKRHLQVVADKTLGAGMVKEVLVDGVYERKPPSQ